MERSRRARLRHHVNNSFFPKAYYLGFPSSHSPVRTWREKKACLYSERVAPAPTESTRPNRAGVGLVIPQPPRLFDPKPLCPVDHLVGVQRIVGCQWKTV